MPARNYLTDALHFDNVYGNTSPFARCEHSPALSWPIRPFPHSPHNINRPPARQLSLALHYNIITDLNHPFITRKCLHIHENESRENYILHKASVNCVMKIRFWYMHIAYIYEMRKCHIHMFDIHVWSICSSNGWMLHLYIMTSSKMQVAVYSVCVPESKEQHCD